MTFGQCGSHKECESERERQRVGERKMTRQIIEWLMSHDFQECLA